MGLQWRNGLHRDFGLIALAAPPSAGWSAGVTCTMAKIGNIGGNTFKNNNLVYNGQFYAPNRAPVLLPMCTLQSEIAAGGTVHPIPCVLDTGETTLLTSTFINNDFWDTFTGPCTGGNCGTTVVATGPNAGGSFGVDGIYALRNDWIMECEQCGQRESGPDVHSV